MCLPSSYQLMDAETAVVKYPDADRPDWIYTNEDGTVNFTFSIEEGAIGAEEIGEARDILAKEMERLYPASVMEEKEFIRQEGRVTASFSFQVPTLDGEVYNVLFFTALKEGLLLGGFNCSGYEKKQWQPVLKQMLQTLKEIEAERVLLE